MSRRRRGLDKVVEKFLESDDIDGDEFLGEIGSMETIDACYIVLMMERGSGHAKDDKLDALESEV